MGLGDTLAPATGIFVGGLGRLGQNLWIIIPVILLFLLIGGVFLYKVTRQKKEQWTHMLRVRRVLKNNLLSKSVYMKMRRFPLIQRAEVFELEKPLLGGYLFPEIEEYSDVNEFSIVLDNNNRIWTNKGEYFNPDKSCVNVSAKHSEIDIARSDLRNDFQNINKVSKRIEWSTIAKYAFFTIAVIALALIAIVGVSKWAESYDYRAKEAEATAQAMDNLASAMLTVESTVNTQKLEIIPMMKEVYKTENLAPIINKEIVLNG